MGIFLCSTILTPTPIVENDVPFSWLLSVNGLINIQQGRIFKGKLEESSIGVVDKVINRMTGEIIEHKEYAKIFNVFKKHLKNKLVYATKKISPSGKIEESTSVLMTENFASFCMKNEKNCTVSVGVKIKRSEHSQKTA